MHFARWAQMCRFWVQNIINTGAHECYAEFVFIFRLWTPGEFCLIEEYGNIHVQYLAMGNMYSSGILCSLCFISNKDMC